MKKIISCNKSNNSTLNSSCNSVEFSDTKEQLFALLKRQSGLYTCGDSTSIPKQTAEKLLSSILYVLNIDFNDENSFLKYSNKNLFEEYSKKIRLIKHKINYAKLMWKQSAQGITPIHNISLYETIKNIGGCFSKYDYNFFADVIDCDIDYQLCFSVPEKFKGIDYIIKYLERIIIENELLSKFSTFSEISILEKYCDDYKGLLINLYEPVVTNAAGLALIGDNVQKLVITKEEGRRIFETLCVMPHDKIKQLLCRADKNLCGWLSISKSNSAEYLENCVLSLEPRISAAVKHGCLDGIFLTE